MFEAPFSRENLEDDVLSDPAFAPDTVSGTAEAELASVQGANAGFQFPRRIWGTMLLCYAAFFTMIYIATGGSGHARFAIIVSVLYTTMYFGLGRVFARQAGTEEISPLDRRQPLQTDTGPMSASTVYAQVLIVPIALVVFGTAIAIVIALNG